MSRPVQPVLVADLLAPLHAELIALLARLSPPDWDRPTRAGSWAVRDVAAHLLDGDLRRLSIARDGLALPEPDRPLSERGSLVELLNQLNAEWVQAARRLSPRLLRELLAFTGPQVSSFLAGLDPQGTAPFPVAWAGEQESRNWLDVGREYTERWHHQQQIREAVAAPLLTEVRWLAPVLDISLRALPHGYRDVTAAAQAAVVVTIRGAAGGTWSLLRGENDWRLHVDETPRAVAHVRMDEDVAWRLFFKAIPRDQAERRVEIQGDRRLGSVILRTLAVMA